MDAMSRAMDNTPKKHYITEDKLQETEEDNTGIGRISFLLIQNEKQLES